MMKALSSWDTGMFWRTAIPDSGMPNHVQDSCINLPYISTGMSICEPDKSSTDSQDSAPMTAITSCNLWGEPGKQTTVVDSALPLLEYGILWYTCECITEGSLSRKVWCRCQEKKTMDA